MNVKGETGTVQVSDEGVGSPGLALFNKLIRNAKEEDLETLLDACIVNIVDSDEEKQEKLLGDLFVLVFQTRDILKGKGERDLFYRLIMVLYKKFPKTVLSLLKFIPDFGYWKDILRIIYFIEGDIKSEKCSEGAYTELREALVEMYANELKSLIDTDKCTLSAKWAPREGSMYNKIAVELAEKIFPLQSGTYRMRSYRKLLSKLTNVVEQQMSAKKFAEIKFEHVPSKAMDRYKKAFLDAKDGTDEDRIKCSENMNKFLLDCMTGKLEMKTKTLLPHEVTKQAIDYNLKIKYGSDSDKNEKKLLKKLLEFINLQWDGVVKKFLEDICEECGAKKEDVVDLLSHTISLCDVSGSMTGIPMDVCIGMGLLTSQFCKAFPDTLITFESEPQMHKIVGEKLSEKVMDISEMPWGGTTDFIAALRMLLAAAQERHIPPADFPKIMFVFSDMQFDAAIGDGYTEKVNDTLRKKYSSNHEVLVGDFKKAGYDVPLIIYWNLRAGTPGHETSADVKGTVMLSGYNPTLLKSVFSGQDLSNLKFEELKKTIDPQKVYENVVSSPNYNKIRDTLKEIKSIWMEELFK